MFEQETLKMFLDGEISEGQYRDFILNVSERRSWREIRCKAKACAVGEDDLRLR